MAKSVRAHGALLINPRRKRKSASRKSSSRKRVRGAGLRSLLSNPRRKRTAKRNPKRRTAARRAAPRRNPRRRVARRAAAPRRNPRRRRPSRAGFRPVRRNARRRSYRRNGPVRRRRARRSAVSLFAAPARKNGRSRRRFRRNGVRRNGMFGKVPVVGGLLDALYSLVPAMIAGAVSVEPSLAVAQITSRYFPMLPTSLLYPLSGGVVALLAHNFLPIKDARLKRDIVVAIAASGAAVGYYKKRTGQDHEAVKEMGALVLSGYGSPIAGAIMGNAGLGEIVMVSGLAGYGGYGDGGGYAVTPMAGAAY